MNKTLAFVIVLLSASAFSQVDQTVDSVYHPGVIIEEAVEYQSQTAADSIYSALVPLNSEQLIQRSLDDNFRERYTGTSFEYDVKEESGFLSRLRDWWRRVLEWLSPDSTETTKVMDEIINIVLVFLSLIALGFLVYYLNKKGFIRLFATKDQQIISEQFIEENIDQINFDQLTQKAKSEGNLRKAVRYYYLWMLKNWSQNGLINYEPNKTTKQYLKEIDHNDNKIDFEYVSYIYDNVWYGYHEITEVDFLKIEDQLQQLINKR